MTFVYKEYDDKIKMAQEQWLQLKKVFIGLLLGNCYLVEKMELLAGGQKFGEEELYLPRTEERSFPGGGMSKF